MGRITRLGWSADGTTIQGWTEDGSWLWDREDEVVLGSKAMYRVELGAFSRVLTAHELPSRDATRFRAWLDSLTSFTID